MAAANSVILTPNTIEEAWQMKAKYGMDAAFMMGGTTFQLQREKGVPLPPYVIMLKALDLKTLQRQVVNGKDVLSIGADVPLRYCMNHPILKAYAPVLGRAAGAVGSPAVRNQGTIGGNIGYRKGDAAASLLALNAEVHFINEKGEQMLPLDQYLSLIEKKAALLLAVKIPLPAPALAFFEKVGSRETFSPSILTVAASADWTPAGRLKHVRIAVGGGDQTPQRMHAVESCLENQALTNAAVTTACDTILEDYAPESDVFAGAEYRKMAAGMILESALETWKKEEVSNAPEK